jgi:hypothetical protein
MRTPKKNSTFIKKWYKTSTLPRLKELGYMNQVEINECPIITEWLNNCFELGNNRYIQDEMFVFIRDKKLNNE